MALRVPFYHQSRDFTCGPACLIMAMRAFDPSIGATRELEIDLWREANMVEAYASSRQGLALAAHRRGFRVRTVGNVENIELLDCLGLDIGKENLKVARALHADLKGRCAKEGIADERRRVSVRDIGKWVAAGEVPLVLVDARLVGDEPLPHWVVPVAVRKRSVIYNDPLARRGGCRAGSDTFKEHIGFGGTSCAVVVEGKHTGFHGTAVPCLHYTRNGHVGYDHLNTVSGYRLRGG